MPSSDDQPRQPAWGVRGDQPGERGCWAIANHGGACRAARRADSDYCSAHAGYGVAADPHGHSLNGRVASAHARRRRADIRLALGAVRLDTPRGALRAAAHLRAERLAWRTIDAALDSDVKPAEAARLALEIIREVDPVATVDISTSFDPAAIDGMSLDEAVAAMQRLTGASVAHTPELPPG